MRVTEFKIQREVVSGSPRTFGIMTKDGLHFGYTMEDEVRGEGEYIKTKTAIPAGRYRLITSFSNRFRREMIQVLNISGGNILFGNRSVDICGIRIHGGLTEADSEGCPLLGKMRDQAKIYNCAGINAELIRIVKEEQAKGVVYLTIENTITTPLA